MFCIFNNLIILIEYISINTNDKNKTASVEIVIS